MEALFKDQGILQSDIALGSRRSQLKASTHVAAPPCVCLVPRRSPETQKEPKTPGSAALLIKLECSCQDGFLLGMAKPATYSAARGRRQTWCVIGTWLQQLTLVLRSSGLGVPRGACASHAKSNFTGGVLVIVDHFGLPSHVSVIARLLLRRLSVSGCPFSESAREGRARCCSGEGGGPGGHLRSLNTTCIREFHRLGANLQQKLVLLALNFDPWLSGFLDEAQPGRPRPIPSGALELGTRERRREAIRQAAARG